jgi:tetratricopeptide (TPR) repeat protein
MEAGKCRVARAAALLAFTVAGSAFGLDASEAKGRAENEVNTVESEVPKIQAAAAQVAARRVSPARRVAEGDLLLRNKDYDRAIHVFHQVVELYDQGQCPAAAYADALFLLGEAYFRDQQFLAARRYFVKLLERAAEPTYASYAGRALSRLVDVCLRTNDLAGIDAVFARMGSLPTSDASGSLQYARGKAFYAKGDLASATNALGTVPSNSPYVHQSQYLLGVVLTKQAAPPPPEAAASAPAPSATGAAATPPAAAAAPAVAVPAAKPRYEAAIEQFRRVTRIPATTDEQRHVVDLAWMAIGRLQYEVDAYLEAAEAYSHVDRKSPEFSTMLYELAWVYVRLGDYQRAQRALEIQRITDPDSMQLADGSLLRADLMLRQGQYEQALAVYQGVRRRYDPLREQVDAFLASTSDPAVYYDKLVEERLAEGSQQGPALPPTVVEWAREQARDERVFAVIDDVTRSRDLVRRTRILAAKLDAVLRSGTRVKAFPELQASLETAVGLLNRVAQARRVLALGLDDVVESPGSGELAEVRAERRKLMQRLAALPTAPADFAKREQSSDRDWSRVSQQLQRLTLEADRLQALVNGLRRVLQDADQYGPAARDPAVRERVMQELATHERDLAAYRQRIRELQDAVETSRVQSGFGDQRTAEDQQARRRFRELFAREVALVAAGSDGADAAAYARDIQPVVSRADRVEASLEKLEQQLQQATEAGAQALLARVAQEAAAVEGYAAALDTLDQEARLLVGEVAMRNFVLVRERLRDVVLRADTGIVQDAWEVREEQRVRVQNLQREKSREQQKLDDELREVLDDAGGD